LDRSFHANRQDVFRLRFGSGVKDADASWIRVQHLGDLKTYSEKVVPVWPFPYCHFAPLMNCVAFSVSERPHHNSISRSRVLLKADSMSVAPLVWKNCGEIMESSFRNHG
jgi:hypothetical protein